MIVGSQNGKYDMCTTTKDMKKALVYYTMLSKEPYNTKMHKIDTFMLL